MLTCGGACGVLAQFHVNKMELAFRHLEIKVVRASGVGGWGWRSSQHSRLWPCGWERGWGKPETQTLQHCCSSAPDSWCCISARVDLLAVHVYWYDGCDPLWAVL